jgi:hypothetical protein
MSSLSASVPRVVCPSVSLPTVAVGLKRKFSGPRAPPNERDTFDQHFESVRSFGKEGLQKRNKKGVSRKEDVLVKLGANPVKQQQMPFKMAIGLNVSRAKHQKKNIERGRESGVLMPRKLEVKKKKSDSGRNGRDSDLGMPRGAVLDLSKGKSNKEFVSRLQFSKESKHLLSSSSKNRNK